MIKCINKHVYNLIAQTRRRQREDWPSDATKHTFPPTHDHPSNPPSPQPDSLI